MMFGLVASEGRKSCTVRREGTRSMSWKLGSQTFASQAPQLPVWLLLPRVLGTEFATFPDFWHAPGRCRKRSPIPHACISTTMGYPKPFEHSLTHSSTPFPKKGYPQKSVRKKKNKKHPKRISDRLPLPTAGLFGHQSLPKRQGASS